MEKALLPIAEYRKIMRKMPILTIDAIVVHKGKYLLLKRKFKPLRGRYWLPGGRVFRGETLQEAVIRKIREEIGIDVRIISLAGFHDYIYKENEFNLDYVHTVSAVFFVSPLSDEVDIDYQSTDYIWSETLPEELNLIR